MPVLFLMLGFGLIGFLDDYIKVVLKRSMGLRAWQKMLAQIFVTTAFIVYMYLYSGIELTMLVPFTDGQYYLDLGWGTIIYLATLASVSPELHEAAYMDGANRLQIIWHVNIPCILPTVVIMLIMNCGRILSVGFEKVYLLQNSLNLDVSQVISTYTYELGLLGGQYSYSTAIGLFNTIVNVVILLIVNMICKRLSDVSLW